MLENFEEARSIRRKNRRGGNPRINEDEKRVSEVARLRKELIETEAAIEFARIEAEKYNIKLNEVKKELKTTLLNSNLDLDVKARMVAEIKQRKENCEFIIRNATNRWAKMTDKKRALEKALSEFGVSR